MPIVRWEPFRDLLSLQDRMNRLFENQMARFHGEEPMTGAFVPPVDIYETENGIVLEADLPGFNQNDLDIRLENSTLTIRGERKLSGEVKEESYHRVERPYGTFVRSFTLPNTVDAQNIQAGYSNGVLRLTLAKREETKPKQIKIQLGGEQKTVEAGR